MSSEVPSQHRRAGSKETALEKRWVLVTADGPQLRDPLVAVRGLAAGGYLPAVAVSCGSSLGALSHDCRHRVDVPPVREPGYVPAIRAELARRPYLTVLPASEIALLALADPPAHLVDKLKLAEAADRVGIPSPPSRYFSSLENLLAAAGELEYPAIVKPVVHRYFASRVESPADLPRAVVHDGPVMVQPYLTHEIRAVSGVLWRGRLVAAVHERWFRIWGYHSGVASAAETIPADPELEERLVALQTGYEGLFHAQFAGAYLLDLNLRIHTSHPLSVAAGVNLVSLYCDLLRGVEVAPVRGRPGVFFRWIEGDIRHIAKAVRRGDMRPGAALLAMLPRRGTAHATESMRDPVPLLHRIWYLARRSAAEITGHARRTPDPGRCSAPASP